MVRMMQDYKKKLIGMILIILSIFTTAFFKKHERVHDSERLSKLAHPRVDK